MKTSTKALLSISIAATCLLMILLFTLAWFSSNNVNVSATQASFAAGSARETVGEMTLGGVMNLVEDGQYSGQTGEYYYYYVLTDNDPAYTYIDTDPNTEGTQFLSNEFAAYSVVADIFTTTTHSGIASSVDGNITVVTNSDGTSTRVDNSQVTPYYTVFEGLSVLYTDDPDFAAAARYGTSTITADNSGLYPKLTVRYLSNTEVKTAYALYTQYQYSALSESTRVTIFFDGISAVTDEESGVKTVTNRDGSYSVLTPEGEGFKVKVFAENGVLLYEDSAENHTTVTVDESENPNTTITRTDVPLASASYIRSYTGVSDVTDGAVRTITNNDGTITRISNFDVNDDGVYDYTEYDIINGDEVLFHQRKGEEGSFKITLIETGVNPVTVVDAGDKLELAKYRVFNNINGTQTYYNTLSPFDYKLFASNGDLLLSYKHGDVSAVTVSLEEEDGITNTVVQLAGTVVEGETVVYRHFEQVGQRQYITQTVGTYNEATSSYDYVLYDRYGGPKYNDCEISIEPALVTAYAVTNSSQNDEAYRYTKSFTVQVVVPEGSMFNLFCKALSIGLVGEYELEIEDADLKAVGTAYCTYITITEEDESVNTIYLFGLEEDTVITDNGEGTVTYKVENYDYSITTAVYVNGVLTSLSVEGGADPDNPYDYDLETENVNLLFRTDRNIYYVYPETLLRDFYWELTLSVSGGYNALTDSAEDMASYTAWLNGEEESEALYSLGEHGYELATEPADWFDYYYCEFTPSATYEQPYYYYENSTIYYRLQINSQAEFDSARAMYGTLYELSAGSGDVPLGENDYNRIYVGENLFTRDMSNGQPYYCRQAEELFEALRLYRKNPDYTQVFYPGEDGKLVDENGDPFVLTETRIFQDSSLTLYFLDESSLEGLENVGYGFDYNRGYYIVNNSTVRPFIYSDIEFMGTRFVLEFDVYGGQVR